MNFYEVDNLPVVDDNAGQVKFNTAMLTYPSDFQQQLTVGVIIGFLEEKLKRNKKCKIVVAREDADEKIQRNHFHIYLDFPRQFSCRPRKFFDIPLEHKVVCFIREDKTRTYEDYNELESKLGWDNDKEMAELLSSYTKDNNFKDYKILSTAHPNLQIKKCYGSKYQMLRYVVKQNLVARANFDVNKEIIYLEDNEKELRNKFSKSIEKGRMKEKNLSIMDELISLAKDLLNKTSKKLKKCRTSDQEWSDFAEWLRLQILDDKMDQPNLFKAMMGNMTWWKIYVQNSNNIDRVIQRFLKSKIIVPEPNYIDHHVFYLPRKLYDYIMWLDDWVRRWNLGEKMEERPKGLVIISPSRFAKTELIISMGNMTYMANAWNLDQWDSKAAFNVFDDIDPGDKEKGLNFGWFKGFFGAQKVLDVTDKYRPKKTIANGKPLIWLSNHELEDVFKNEKDLAYIKANCEIVKLNRPLHMPAEDWIEGHNDYVKFDTRSTWWFKHAVQQQPVQLTEEEEDVEPLNERKRRLSFTQEAREHFEEDQGRLLYELEQKIETINWWLNEYEKEKGKLECELQYLNQEYISCQKLFQNNHQFIQYRQAILDRSFKVNNLIQLQLGKIDRLQHWKKLCIDCYYYVDKAMY